MPTLDFKKAAKDFYILIFTYIKLINYILLIINTISNKFKNINFYFTTNNISSSKLVKKLNKILKAFNTYSTNIITTLKVISKFLATLSNVLLYI